MDMQSPPNKALCRIRKHFLCHLPEGSNFLVDHRSRPRRQARGDPRCHVRWFCEVHQPRNHGDGAEQVGEEGGGSERVPLHNEDHAIELGDTAFESYDTAECNKLTTVSSVGLIPGPHDIGIQSRGFEPDHALRSSPTQGLFGCGFQ